MKSEAVLIHYSLLLLTSFKKWWAKMDSLSCGKATAVTTCHRHVVKSRLSSHFVFTIFRYILAVPSKLNNAKSEHLVLTIGRY